MSQTLEALPSVIAPLAYLHPSAPAAEYRIYPASAGRSDVRPLLQAREVPIRDARPLAHLFSLDVEGFAFHRHATPFQEFYDEAQVRSGYYPEVSAWLCHTLGARAVLVFDHNTRSVVRAARGQAGVRLPVDGVHNDYSEASGPKRAREILTEAGRDDLLKRPFAFVNLWRPILGPVQDIPLAVCDARSLSSEEIVDTPIHHFAESDLEHPSHSGEIQSMHHAEGHRWFYFPDMQPHDVLLLKCFDTRLDGVARFMAHTGFRNPACPAEYTPRESIEARTLVVY
ncbi:MAG: methyltransferase [Gammaproteobacteria bacterium]|nr:methyltransferase [Gammaproteobacteria bacterium]